MKTTARTVLANRLKELRTEWAWSQHDLAAASGLDQDYIDMLERCEGSATIDTLEQLAGAFEIPLSKLLQA